jgi:mannobiose 2-epimerase
MNSSRRSFVSSANGLAGSSGGKTVLGLFLSMALLALPVWAMDRPAQAKELKTELITQVLPYWQDTAVDKANGGYLLSDNAARPSAPATEKQLVTQARMVWGFAHAHLKHLGDGKRDYLKAALDGAQFLQKHFKDRENGGYIWTVTPEGKPLVQRKIVYGESFVIYAYVELFRASGEAVWLDEALALYRVLQSKTRDAKNGGWIEHFERDWTPILKHDGGIQVEVGGFKSANTHLHLMEALSELAEASQDAAVKKSVEEALRINKKYFYPLDAGHACFHRQLDWQPVTAASSAGLSYGHNVEFAWLMIRAEKVLGKEPSWDHFYAHIDHALKYGWDQKNGGLFHRGVGDQPATDTDKIWWVQAEMLAALTNALLHQENRKYSDALDRLLAFVAKYQANPGDRIWLDTVTAEGKPKNASKAHNWKANYHDVRAIMKYVDAFSEAAK